MRFLFDGWLLVSSFVVEGATAVDGDIYSYSLELFCTYPRRPKAFKVYFSSPPDLLFFVRGNKVTKSTPLALAPLAARLRFDYFYKRQRRTSSLGTISSRGLLFRTNPT